MQKRRTAAEIIAFHFCSDIADVRDCRYQPTRYASPAIFVLDDDYYAAPSNNKPPRAEVGQPWELIGSYYGRSIFRSRSA